MTGPAPAQDAQGVIIQRYLPWIELATVLFVITLIVNAIARWLVRRLAPRGVVAV